MNYNELLESHLSYGTKKCDILRKDDFDKVLKNVVIAPWWSVNIFNSQQVIVEKINDKIYNVRVNDIEFTYVQLQLIGSSAIMDYVLRLGVSRCRNLIFIGSVGALDKNIIIGDIAIPEYSICGEGASRYLNDDLNDDFGRKFYPNREFTESLIDCSKKVCEKNSIKMHIVKNFSADSIFAQFPHIEYVKSTEVNTIELETSSFFKAAEMAGIRSTALLCVSDNTTSSKSLFSGREASDRTNKHKVRNEIIPEIVINLLKKIGIDDK